MRPLYKILEAMTDSPNILSLHLKSFTLNNIYLTIHDIDKNCFMYQAKDIPDLEKQVVDDHGGWLKNAAEIKALPMGPTQIALADVKKLSQIAPPPMLPPLPGLPKL